jgi:uncharacterized membrane protein
MWEGIMSRQWFAINWGSSNEVASVEPTGNTMFLCYYFRERFMALESELAWNTPDCANGEVIRPAQWLLYRHILTRRQVFNWAIRCQSPPPGFWKIYSMSS